MALERFKPGEPGHAARLNKMVEAIEQLQEALPGLSKQIEHLASELEGLRKAEEAPKPAAKTTARRSTKSSS